MTSTNTVVSSRTGSRYFASSLAAATVILLAAACSTSSGSDAGSPPFQTLCGPFTADQPEATTCASPGGAVTGSQDAHCAMNGKQVAQATTLSCPTGPADSGTVASDSAASSDDSGSSGDDAGGGGPGVNDGRCPGGGDYQPTMNNHSGSDDDCKYDVSWTSTPICENGNVYFMVTVKKRAFADGGSAVGGDEPPMTGGTVSTEVTFNCAPAPNSSTIPSFVEDPKGSGTYRVGPVLFDKKGKWDVRFHFNECCNDGPTSPHGHAAFWVNVP